MRHVYCTAFLVAAALAAPVAAKTISITLAPTAQLTDDTITVKANVANRGDEAAQSVVPTLYFGDAKVRGKGVPALPPGGTMEEELSLPAKVGAGRWPYRLTIDYTDANQYPFQAAHTLVVTKDSPPPPKVTIPSIGGMTIAGSGTLEVKLKNMSADERKVTLTVQVPEGLEVTTPRQDITLDGWEEEVVSVPVENRTALAGSRLPVFAVVEYDEDGAHQTVIGQDVSEIVPAQSFFAERRVFLWLGAALLVLAWGGFVVSRLVRR
jgi:CARDB